MVTASLISAAARRLEGKVAVITGGASGIGRCTAKVFAHHGAKILIADIQDDLARSLSESIGEANCKYIRCDVTNESQVKNAVDKAVKTFGKLDIMFNNAGITNKPSLQVVDDKKEDFERVLSVNATGVFLGIKHAARVMIPARSGSIICNGSICTCSVGGDTYAYTASKHAVLGLTKNAAFELGKYGIRVNCVSPYAIATPMATQYFHNNEEMVEKALDSVSILKNTTLKEEDIANAALYLASDEGRYVNGHNLLVDGGYTIANPSLSELFTKFDR